MRVLEWLLRIAGALLLILIIMILFMVESALRKPQAPAALPTVTPTRAPVLAFETALFAWMVDFDLAMILVERDMIEGDVVSQESATRLGQTVKALDELPRVAAYSDLRQRADYHARLATSCVNTYAISLARDPFMACINTVQAEVRLWRALITNIVQPIGRVGTVCANGTTTTRRDEQACADAGGAYCYLYNDNVCRDE